MPQRAQRSIATDAMQGRGPAHGPALRAANQKLRQELRGASEVAPDETGWREAGRNASLHAFIRSHSTCYVIDLTRGPEPAEELLPRDWSGTLVHEDWSV